jgi:hypothetical protein
MPRRRQFSFVSCLVLAFALGCSSGSPIPSGGPVDGNAQKKGPIVRVYRLDGEYYDRMESHATSDDRPEPPANSFRTWPILESKLIADPQLARELRQAVYERSNFSAGGGADCFWPGLGIEIGEGDEQVDAVICLKCDWLHLYAAGKKLERIPLSASGKQEFMRLYAEAFPEQSEGAGGN